MTSRPIRPNRHSSRAGLLATAGALLAAGALSARQLPLSPPRDAGQTVTPVFEGWYPNPDGTFSLSFGYYNRNREQVIEIPIGSGNFFEPGPQDLGQPTEFHPQRHWGVFTVKVPADFGAQRLVWTLESAGETFAVPGHLEKDWLLDAKLDPASGNTPPLLKFDRADEGGRGPDAIVAGPVRANVGEPLEITVWATDDEIQRSTFSRQREPILLTWFKHRGPGKVEFSEREPAVDKENEGRSQTRATFSAPGEYVLRVRAVDYSGLSSGGHSQCCWSNGYLKVAVED
ncbi:MAG TPA: hypothetical protein VMT85_23145 [Thermoanaerobaculia bacterium]|nr:hypothetical protein [Thermoanaerobaculia bacterium]